MHLATGDEPTRGLALAARPFLLSLLRSSPEHGPYFGYIPAEAPLVHNANLLVCGTLARLHELEPDEAARPVVEAATRTTLSLVRDDGLWPYGELPNFRWVDNFHTAYTLEGLAHVSSVFGIGTEALARGASAWRERFVEPDGWTRYYPDRRFPLETHCCASAIDLVLTLESKGAEPDWGDLARVDRGHRDSRALDAGGGQVRLPTHREGPQQAGVHALDERADVSRPREAGGPVFEGGSGVEPAG